MKQSRMKPVSDKQAARTKKLAKIKAPKGQRCEICGKPANWIGLQKHHKTRRSDGGKDALSNLQWLCQACHDKQVGEKSRDKTKPIDRPTDITGMSGYHGLRAAPKPGKKVKGGNNGS